MDPALPAVVLGPGVLNLKLQLDNLIPQSMNLVANLVTSLHRVWVITGYVPGIWTVSSQALTWTSNSLTVFILLHLKLTTKLKGDLHLIFKKEKFIIMLDSRIFRGSTCTGSSMLWSWQLGNHGWRYWWLNVTLLTSLVDSSTLCLAISKMSVYWLHLKYKVAELSWAKLRKAHKDWLWRSYF